MSKSHIESNLIVKNSLIGIDESMVAYFPFKNSVNDVIKGLEPMVNENTTLTEDGIAVEEATINQMASPEFTPSSLGNNWGSWQSSVLTYERVKIFNKETTAVNLTKRTSESANAIHQSRNELTVGDDYTLSCYARINPSSSVLIGSLDLYINNYTTKTITKDWSRLSITQAASAASNTIHITQRFTSYDVQIAMVQFEKKSFTTSFVNGDRGNSSLIYPVIPIESFTVSGWVTPKEPTPFAYYHKNTFVNLDHVDGYSTNDTISMFFRGNIQGSPCLAFWTSMPATWHNTSISVPTGVKSMVTYRYDYGAKIMDIFLDGELVYSKAGIDKKLNPIINFQGHGSTDELPNATLKDFLIYNRAISDKEILQLYLSQDSFYCSNEEVSLL